MKKIFLLLLLLCTLSFTETTGFIDLKWGSSKEDSLKYMKDTFGVEPLVNGNTIVTYNSKNIKLEGLELLKITFFYSDNKKFYSWTGSTPNVTYDKNFVKEKFKKKYLKMLLFMWRMNKTSIEKVNVELDLLF